MLTEALAPRASAEMIWLSLDRAVAIQVKHFASSYWIWKKKKKKRQFGVCGDGARRPCGPFPRRWRSTSDHSCVRPCCCWRSSPCQILPNVLSSRKRSPQVELGAFLCRKKTILLFLSSVECCWEFQFDGFSSSLCPTAPFPWRIFSNSFCYLCVEFNSYLKWSIKTFFIRMVTA